MASQYSESQAKFALAEQRSLLLVNMFGGTRLRLGTQNAKSSLKKVGLAGKNVYKNSSRLVSGGRSATTAAPPAGIRSAIDSFIRECADVSDINDVVEAIGSQAFSDLVGEITPIIGILWSGKKLVQATAAVVEDARNLYKHSYYRSGFRAGEPQAAADAIKTIITRDLACHSVDVARQAASTGAKIAGCFADLGTATTVGIGLANALAGLGLQLFALGIDIKDMKAGNARLVSPDTLDATVFGECPILGCYLITCADTSAVVDLYLNDIGTPGWMDKVEKLKRENMDPLLTIAKKAIKSSHLQLEGLASNKGTINEKGFFAKIKSRMVKEVFG
jgi:hypothetical protein